MTDEVKHECAVALVVLRKPTDATGDFGGTKLSLLLEKQHNRGQDGAGAAILSENPTPGSPPYWIGKSASATSLADVLALIARRNRDKKCRERIFLGHLRYATFGKNDVAFCHPFVHKSSCLDRTLLLAGNFNLTDNRELFDKYVALGHHPDSRADGYLLAQLMAHHLGKTIDEASSALVAEDFARIIADTLACADGAWTLCGMTGAGWAFATRDPNGIRPCFCYVDDGVVVVASERPAIQAAFDVPPEAVKELPPGASLVVSPDGQVVMSGSNPKKSAPRPCSFERIYFSRANDADIHRERKALGAALAPRILEAADAPMDRIFFSYIPNSARISFHGLLEELFKQVVAQRRQEACQSRNSRPRALRAFASLRETSLPRFGEVIVKDAKFRTFIADAAARREFYKHVYDVTYGLVRPGKDTLVVLDDSIVRGNTMKNAILPMLDRLGPRRIVIASSAPPIRYPDCYGIDMSTLDELVAFRALVNLLGPSAERELESALRSGGNALASLYARFAPEEHCAEIARLLTPSGLKAEVKVVFQSVDALHAACPNDTGDWYFTGDYPTPGGYKVLHTALRHYLERNNERSY